MANGIFYPAVSGDDGGIDVFSFDTSSVWLSIGDRSGNPCEQYFRFTNVTIPNGAVIINAFVRLTAYQANSGTACNMKCHLNAHDDAVAPTSSVEFYDLALTTGVAWDSLSAWADGNSYDTPSIVSEVQSVVDRVGWASGNAIIAVLMDNNSDVEAARFISAIDYLSGAEKAELHIEWSTGYEINLTPFLSTTSLQANPHLELTAGALSSETSISTGELYLGIPVFCPSPLIVTSSLKTNIHIELTTPSPLTATSGLLSTPEIQLSVTPFIATSAILAIPVAPFSFVGAKRIYLFALTGAADGVDDIVIPIKSFQSRLKSGDPTYLSVVIPGTDYASEINLRLNGDLVVRMGYLSNGEIILSEIISIVDFENIIIYDGTINKTITLDGHRTETFTPKEINLTGSSYKNLTAGKLRYRCTPNLYVRPGDTVNIDDDSFTIENITYSVSPELETFEVSE